MTSALATYGSSRTIVRNTFSGTDMTLQAARVAALDPEWGHQHWSPFTNASSPSILNLGGTVMDIAYGAGLYVAASKGSWISGSTFNSSNIFTSPDLVTWTSRASASGVWQAVIWTGTQFVAVTSNSLYTSPDGITWTAKTLPSGAYCGLDYVPSLGLHVLSGISGTNIYTSPDCTTWTTRAVGANITGPGCFGAGVYIVPTDVGLKYTTNFSSFTTATLKNSHGTTVTWGTGAQNCSAYGIVFDGTKFHAIIKINDIYVPTYITSTDGINWTIVAQLYQTKTNYVGPGISVGAIGSPTYQIDSSIGFRINSTLCVVNGVVFAMLLKNQSFNNGSSTSTSSNIQLLRLNGDSFHELELGPLIGGSLVGYTTYTGTMRNTNGRILCMPHYSDQAQPRKFEVNLNAREIVYVL